MNKLPMHRHIFFVLREEGSIYYCNVFVRFYRHDHFRLTHIESSCFYLSSSFSIYLHISIILTQQDILKYFASMFLQFCLNSLIVISMHWFLFQIMLVAQSCLLIQSFFTLKYYSCIFLIIRPKCEGSLMTIIQVDLSYVQQKRPITITDTRNKSLPVMYMSFAWN